MSDPTRNTEESERFASPALLDSEPSLDDAGDRRETPFREGLPSGYRMRADAHYVEQLDSPPMVTVQSLPLRAIEGAEAGERPVQALVESITRHGVLEPLLVQKRDGRYRLITGRKRLIAARTAGLAVVPCLVHRVSDDEARQLGAATAVTRDSTPPAAGLELAASEEAVQRSLSAILSCAPLLHDGLPALTRSVAVDMVKAEAHRATCALAVMRVIRHGAVPTRQPAAACDVVRRLVERITPDLRLRGMAVETATRADGTVAVDAEQLACTLASVVFMLSATLERGAGSRLSVSAMRDEGGVVTIAIEQEGVVLPDAWLAVATGDPDGAVLPELMPVLALRRVAEASGGRVMVSRLRRASRVAIELPASEE